MLTTTTPLAARREPSCRGSELPPATKPPPWIQTITGSLADGDVAFGQAFTERQSPLILSPKSMSPNTFGWMQGSPNSVAAFTPSHFATGCGAFQRLAPPA